MGGKCKWCGEPYIGAGVCPSSWGIFRRQAAASRGYDSYDLYCSEKCRAEAEAGKGGGGGESKSAPESSSSSSSDSEPMLSPGCSAVLGKIVTGVVILLGLIIVLGVIFGKNEDTSDPAVVMEMWHEHLEKRRAAFAEGLPEEGVEARGLKNYTWEEWQALKQKGQEKSDEKVSNETKSLVDLWREHQAKRRELGKTMTEDQLHEAGYDAMYFDEFKAKFGDDPEAKLKRLDARLAELQKGVKTGDRQSPVTSAVAPKVPASAPKPSAVPVAARERTITSEDGNAAGGQKNTVKKASKDSKAIRIIVQGKGKTKDAAVRWALRDAVWKTVGTWVDSKSRIQENQDKVLAQVKTITEADVSQFEVIDTQEQNGGFVVKVKVSVSKKKIAPKFAKVFPDVFTIE